MKYEQPGSTGIAADRILTWLDENSAGFTQMAQQIWLAPELAWQEEKSAALQAEFLEEQGFVITSDIAGIATAFSAEWGAGDPVVGFVGEYDALPGLSQKAVPFHDPVVAGGPGHGCGHNLLGTGCLAAAVALRWWLEEQKLPGTVRYYGCPAEEQISAKAFMARTGCFDDLDAAMNYHPSNLNMPGKGTAVGVYDAIFRFKGTTSHAGGSPEKGRSALDAVELMNVGANYLREHVPEKVRIHYAITDGGRVPNIVPDSAAVWYFVRAPERSQLDEVFNRLKKVAEGAALMTETTVSTEFRGACSSVLNNHYLADLHYKAMERIGPIEFSASEYEFAEQLNSHYSPENLLQVFKDLRVPDNQAERIERLKGAHLIGENFPAMNEDCIGTGSTDVGDVSWITPLSMLGTSCFPTGVAGHSWGVTAASGMSIGSKGMLHAAKIMAFTAARLYLEPEHLENARAEFDEKTAGNTYTSPIPPGVAPPLL